jgi:hypothetical protein
LLFVLGFDWCPMAAFMSAFGLSVTYTVSLNNMHCG